MSFEWEQELPQLWSGAKLTLATVQYIQGNVVGTEVCKVYKQKVKSHGGQVKNLDFFLG